MSDTYILELNESERQTVILALAELALERPGWTCMLAELVAPIDPNLVYFNDLQRIHKDRIKGMHPRLKEPEI